MAPDVVDVDAARAERSRVLGLVKAVSARNWSLVARVSRGAALEAGEASWTASGCLALQLWLCDTIAGTEAYYSTAEKFGLDRLPRSFLDRALTRSQLPCQPGIAVTLAAMALLGT